MTYNRDSSIYLSVVLVFLLIIVSGCSGFSNASASTETTSELSFEFPLAVGNYWNYEFSSNIEEPTIGDISLHVTQAVSISDSVEGFQLTEEMVEGLFFVERYQSSQNTGLYLHTVGTQSPTSYLNLFKKTKLKTDKQFLFKDRYFKSIEELTLFSMSVIPTFNETPIMVLKYPLKLNSEWIYVQTNDSKISRRVVSTETISLPCGDFECYKIQWLWDLDNDGEWDDDIEGYTYVSSQGIIKTTELHKNVALIELQDDELVITGYMDVTNVVTLIDYHLE